MEQPFHTFTDEVLVAYHAFDIEDASRDNVDEPPSDGWFAEDNLTVRQGIVYLVSPGHTHRAIVTVQAWGEEPPEQPDGAWETTADVEIACRSGAIIVMDGMQEHPTEPVDLGSGPMIYHLRVNSRGHERMRAIEGGGVVPEQRDQFRHVEHYLFQLWPARPIPDDAPAPFRRQRATRRRLQ